MVGKVKTLSTRIKATMKHRETQARRCTPIERIFLHGWSRLWHRYQERKKKIRNACGIRQTVQSIKKLRKEDIEEVYVDQSGGTFCRSTAGGHLLHQRRKVQIPRMLTKLMPMSLKDAVSTKAANKSTKSIAQFHESFKLGSFADTYSKSDAYSGSRSGSGQGMG